MHELLRSTMLVAMLFVVAGVAAPPVVAADKPALDAAESYFGFNLDQLAEALAQLTTLRTQFGEGPGKAKFDAWLMGHGHDRARYDAAWSAWWSRFQADATKLIEARFTTLNAQYTAKLNYADAPRQEGESREGVTLDRYARISVALIRPNAQADQVLKANGIAGGSAQWQRVNTAWAEAMKESGAGSALIQQYAELFQKYSGPQWAAEQEKSVADAMAKQESRPAPSPNQPAPPSLEARWSVLSSAASPVERWHAARDVAHACSLWQGPGRSDPKDPRAAHCTPAALRQSLLPAILDAVEHHDDESLTEGTNMLDFLDELGLKDATGRATLERALHRDQDRLAALEAQFKPIQDKAVPERMFLRPKIDGYQAAVRDLKRALAAW